MRRIFLTLLFLLTACQVPIIGRPPAPVSTATPVATATPGSGFTVLYHPDGPLYVGDQVSFEILTPAGFQSKDRRVRVEFADPSTRSHRPDVPSGGQGQDEMGFQSFGIGARSQATFYWAWDTRGLKPGVYPLTFSILPSGSAWTEKVTLLPAAGIPHPEPDARWKSVSTDCCTVNYISGTDAERDIETLKTMLDTQAADVAHRLGTNFKGKIPITFMPRVLGQGGYTSDAIYVSYLDQDYAGSTIAQVVHHEMVHWLDGQMGGETRPIILIEGLAVFMSDGHFKVEPIFPRAAALIQTGQYIPLRALADTFYTSQHEIGYMEAAALVGYLIQTYGWERYNAFYRDLHPLGGSDSGILNAGLQAHFNLSLAQIETNFTAFLRQQTVTQADLTDVRLTVAFYDTVRRYQLSLDPSAYFLTAWLADGTDMRQRGIVADYLRHPRAVLNQRIESLLVSAYASLRAGDYTAADTQVSAANLLLDHLKNAEKNFSLPGKIFSWKP